MRVKFSIYLNRRVFVMGVLLMRLRTPMRTKHMFVIGAASQLKGRVFASLNLVSPSPISEADILKVFFFLIYPRKIGFDISNVI